MDRLSEKLAYSAFPKIFFEAFRTYFRVEVEGMEHIPRRGKVLIVPNHSGCSGLDAIVLGYLLHKNLHRVPRILALWTIFNLVPFLAKVGVKMGLKPASIVHGLELLRKNHLTVLFPEGIHGSFKPTSQMYHLQPFHTGFLRMALLTGAPVVPCIVIGAEESNINFGMVQFNKYLKGLAMPLPFNLIPFPAKWKIKFLPPLDLSTFKSEDSENKLKLKETAEAVRNLMQSILDTELGNRNYVFFGKAAY